MSSKFTHIYQTNIDLGLWSGTATGDGLRPPGAVNIIMCMCEINPPHLICIYKTLIIVTIIIIIAREHLGEGPGAIAICGVGGLAT